MAELERSRFKIDGMNSWSTTLYAAGLSKRRLFVSDKEFSAILITPSICRKLSAGEEIKPGTIGAIRKLGRGSEEEQHGFLTIDDNRIFTKIDSSFETRPQYRSLTKDFKTFADLNSSFEFCAPRLSHSPQRVREAACATWIDYYVCDSSKRALDSIRDSRAKVALAELDSIADEFEKYLHTGQPMSEDRAVTFGDRLSNLAIEILDLPKGPEADLLFATYESLAYQYTALVYYKQTPTDFEKDAWTL